MYRWNKIKATRPTDAQWIVPTYEELKQSEREAFALNLNFRPDVMNWDIFFGPEEYEIAVELLQYMPALVRAEEDEHASKTAINTALNTGKAGFKECGNKLAIKHAKHTHTDQLLAMQVFYALVRNYMLEPRSTADGLFSLVSHAWDGVASWRN